METDRRVRCAPRLLRAAGLGPRSAIGSRPPPANAAQRTIKQPRATDAGADNTRVRDPEA